MVASNSGFEKVGVNSTFMTHLKADGMLNKSGYLYVFVSNLSPGVDVYFDNLQITHKRGPLLEETHYYPFGLTMPGLSSTAANFGTPSNKFKYSSKEEQKEAFNDGYGLEWIDYGWRIYDPQIGRFFTQDAYAERYD